MTIRFHCNECQSRVKVPDGTEGKKVKCPRCGNVQRVPEDDGLPSPGRSARKAEADTEAKEQAIAQPPEPPEPPEPPQSGPETVEEESDGGDPLAALAAAAGDEDEDDEGVAPSPWSEPDAEQTQPEPDETESETEVPDTADADADTDEPEQADPRPRFAGDQRSPLDDQPSSAALGPGPEDQAQPKPKPAPKAKSKPESEPPAKGESPGKPKVARPTPNPQPAATPKAIPLSSRTQSSYHPPATVNPQSEQVAGDDARSREAVEAQPPAQKLASGKAVQPPAYPALQAISWALRILAVLTLAMGGGMSVPLFRGESVMLGLTALIVGLVLAVLQLALGEAVSALRDIARNSFHLRR